MSLFKHDGRGILHHYCDLRPGIDSTHHSISEFRKISIIEGGRHAQYPRSLNCCIIPPRKRKSCVYRITMNSEWWTVEVGGKTVYDSRGYPLSDTTAGDIHERLAAL